MKKLEPYPIASAFFYIFTILYLICISAKLILTSLGIEGFWHMHKIWELLLPGFNGIDSLSVIIGLLEVSLGSYLIVYIIVPLYNYLSIKYVREHKIKVKPIIVRFKTLFLAFTVYVFILFSLCLLYDLVVPTEYQMLGLWKILLPGFIGLNLESYLFGLIDIIILSAYSVFIFSKTLNYFERSELKKPDKNTAHEMKVLDETKSSDVRYSSKYFGITLGIFTVIIFLLIVIKSLFSESDNSIYLKPFIPFFDSMSIVNIIGGIVISFLWGLLVGYFFIVTYNWFDKKLNPQERNQQV